MFLTFSIKQKIPLTRISIFLHKFELISIKCGIWIYENGIHISIWFRLSIQLSINYVAHSLIKILIYKPKREKKEATKQARAYFINLLVHLWNCLVIWKRDRTHMHVAYDRIESQSREYDEMTNVFGLTTFFFSIRFYYFNDHFFPDAREVRRQQTPKSQNETKNR